MSAEGGGEPPRKKVKSTDILKTQEKLIEFNDEINTAAHFLRTQFATSFCFVKILGCNGAYPCSFSQAWCETARSIEEKKAVDRRVVYFGSVFNIDCIHQLQDAVDVEALNYGPSKLIAFERLADFLCSMKETESVMEKVLRRNISEFEWASVLGTHVLRKLSVSQQMTVSDTGNSDRSSLCACGCRTPIVVGDTSIGHKDVWHGSVDILLGHIAVLSLVGSGDESAEDSSDDTDEKHSASELKLGNIEFSRNQLIAGTLVFSYLHNCGLVPTMAISKENVKIFMYEPATDLLYEGSEQELFLPVEEGEYKYRFNIVTVVSLWLAINYLHFCTGSKSSHLKFGYFANFETAVSTPKLDIYQRQLRMGGCKHGQRTKPNFHGVSCSVNPLP